MTQIKIPAEIKREIGIFASVTNRTQSQLMAEAWLEYRARHSNEFREGLQWAEDVLSDPESAAVAASGLEREQIEEIDRAFAGDTDQDAQSVGTASDAPPKRTSNG
jgi:predicted transcriptional regulator